MSTIFKSVKASFCLAILVFICFFGKAQPAGNQIFWRTVQLQNEKDNQVIRIYLDKYGYFYPATSVEIIKQDFLYPYKRVTAKDTVSGNLYAYFKRHPDNSRQFFQTYDIVPTLNFNADYYKAQEVFLKRTAKDIHNLVAASNAKNIVFLIHGFNEPDPTKNYQYFRSAVKSAGFEEKSKPIYIEIYWDGLTTKNNPLLFSSVWKHAQSNTRYISLALRDLMRHITDPLNFVVVTHSLGASVATGALFNCTSKWKASRDTTIDHELATLMKAIPAKVDAQIRLAMIVPAIPGVATFVDFNKRSPDIETIDNKINRIIIGFNPKDFATRKYVLSAVKGSTTLGCNWGQEISKVKIALSDIGYSKNLVVDLKFKTPPKYGLEDHDFKAYMNDSANFNNFLAQIFNP